MARLEILNPVAKTVEYSVKPAARLQAVDGATIGLYWNIKAGGDAALDKTEELLRARFPKAKFRRYTGSVGWLMRHCTAEDADRMASEGAAVVGTPADWGSCTSWGAHDMVELERRGIPTVLFTAQT